MCLFQQQMNLALALAAIAIGVAGCKQKSNLVPVEGKVSLNGKSLANATVMLSPARGNGPGPFVGLTNSQGQFSLGPVGKDGGGAAVDSYMLMITTVKPDPNQA